VVLEQSQKRWKRMRKEKGGGSKSGALVVLSQLLPSEKSPREQQTKGQNSKKKGRGLERLEEKNFREFQLRTLEAGSSTTVVCPYGHYVTGADKKNHVGGGGGGGQKRRKEREIDAEEDSM